MARRKGKTSVLGRYGVGILVGLAALALGHEGRAAASSPGGKVKTNPRTGQPISSFGGRKLSVVELLDLATHAGFLDPELAVKHAIHESGGWTEALADTRGMTDAELHAAWGPTYDGKKLYEEYSVGLWQVNVFDPNVRRAASLPDDFDAAAAAMKDPEQNARAIAALTHKGVSWGGK